MLNDTELLAAVSRLRARHQAEQPRLAEIDRYVTGEGAAVYRPSQAGREYRTLMRRARSGWPKLVVDVVTQSLYVDGYRAEGASDDMPVPWRIWQANGLDARQITMHRAALTYGQSYVRVAEGDDGTPVIRGVSPKRAIALYDDPGADEWPALVLHVVDDDGRIDVYDDTHLHRLQVTIGDDGREQVGLLADGAVVEHGAAHVPWVRLAADLDLEGRSQGEVWPLRDMHDRVTQTVFDLLMTQTFASFKVRTVTGMTMPTHENDDGDTVVDIEAARAHAAKLSQDRMLAADDPDARFGTLDETPLDGFIASIDQAVRHLAAVSQTPPVHLLGQMANLSAEALQSAEVSLLRKVQERQAMLGEAWEQVLRLAAQFAGDSAAAADVTASVKWRDVEGRALASAVDAWGKAVQMLGVPPEGTWDRIPGVDTTDVESWRNLRRSADPFAASLDELARQAETATLDPAVAGNGAAAA